MDREVEKDGAERMGKREGDIEKMDYSINYVV